MARRFTYGRHIGLPKNWPKVPKRIKKKYIDKCVRYWKSLLIQSGPTELKVEDW